MHESLGGDKDKDGCFRTINLYEKHRFIYFFSDALHLVKTARNCLFHSRLHSRLMWKGGIYLIWEHIAKNYHEDLNRNIKLLPALQKSKSSLLFSEQVSKNC